VIDLLKQVLVDLLKFITAADRFYDHRSRRRAEADDFSIGREAAFSRLFRRW
jgi:hypothetical protein